MDRAEEQALWDALIANESTVFKTAKGLPFTYTIRGNELFVSRKEKSITRATVNIAYQTAKKVQARGQTVTGPKMLTTFGASYLYPIFMHIGVIHVKGKQLSFHVDENG